MRVAIRVDASADMGTGHVRRCLSLAEALIELRASVWMVCRPLDAVSANLLDRAPCPVLWLAPPDARAARAEASPEAGLPPHHAWARVAWDFDAGEVAGRLREVGPDWVVVDHYAFDHRWHARVREALGCRIAVVNDPADRTLDPDMLVDHNWAEDHRVKYSGRLLPQRSGRMRLLGGPRFALLSAAYRRAPRYRFHPEVRSIGIFMGGTDPSAISAKVLEVCRRQVGFSGPIEVVSTSANPHLRALREACAAWPATSLTLDEPSLEGFFARHDLQIGAGGGSTWERCCIGVPTVALVVAANQAVVVPALARLGALKAAVLDGTPGAGTPTEALSKVLGQLLGAPGLRRQLADAAAALVDGRGAERVALGMLRDALQLRLAAMADAPLLHGWRNHPSVRAFSHHGAEIPYEDHVRWMKGKLDDPSCDLLVGQIGAQPVGSIRFERKAPGVLEVSLYLDPDLQGLGLGARLLLTGEQFMAARLAEAFTVTAAVVQNNRASQRLFEACGYGGGPLAYEKRVPALSRRARAEPTAS